MIIMQVQDMDGVVVVTLVADQAVGLWRAIEPHVDAGHTHVVIDLSAVEFLNSVNIAAIIAARKKVLAVNGRFAIANCRDRVKAIFRVLKLDQLFALDRTLESAIAAVR
jgi:anti-anti-sigma factor